MAHHSPAARLLARSRPGFSLLELMLVLAIMGLLMGVVAYNMLGTGERAKKRATEVSLKNIKGGLESYMLEYSAAPASLQQLVSAKILSADVKLRDGWDSDFLYDPTPQGDRKFSLGSAGPDKQPGTEDDLSAFLANP